MTEPTHDGRSATRSADENEAFEDQPKSRPGKLKRFGKGAAKVVGKVSAADVLFKDAKRMRPRHPQLWKDLWNARELLKQQKEAEQNNKGHYTPLWKAKRNALITSLVGVAIALYGIILISLNGQTEHLTLLAKLSMTALVCIGLMQAGVYGWIALKLTQRQMMRARGQQGQTGHPRSSVKNRSHNSNA